MVMRLRLNQRAEMTVTEAWGSVEKFQQYLNAHPSYTFMEAEKRYVNGKWVVFPPSVVLLCDRTKVVLSPPVFDQDGKDVYFFRIITLRTTSREDRVEALAGKEVKEPIEVQPNMPGFRPPPTLKPIEQPATIPEKATAPTITTVLPEPAIEEIEKGTKPTVPATPQPSEDRQRFLISPTCPKCLAILVPGRGIFCQACGVRLPADVGVHPELVIVIKKSDYEKLAVHLKQGVNAAWTRLVRGRKVEKTLYSMGQNLFLIVVADEVRTSTLAQEEELNDILTETGIGRVTSDLYEICEARKMLNNKQDQASD
jgi:hypothetical protein